MLNVIVLGMGIYLALSIYLLIKKRDYFKETPKYDDAFNRSVDKLEERVRFLLGFTLATLAIFITMEGLENYKNMIMLLSSSFGFQMFAYLSIRDQTNKALFFLAERFHDISLLGIIGAFLVFFQDKFGIISPLFIFYSILLLFVFKFILDYLTDFEKAVEAYEHANELISEVKELLGDVEQMYKGVKKRGNKKQKPKRH